MFYLCLSASLPMPVSHPSTSIGTRSFFSDKRAPITRRATFIRTVLPVVFFGNFLFDFHHARASILAQSLAATDVPRVPRTHLQRSPALVATTIISRKIRRETHNSPIVKSLHFLSSFINILVFLSLR